MGKQRVDRLNSLLKEVIADVIRKNVKNPHIHRFVSISRVQISKDLRYAKVYVSMIGSDKEKRDNLQALQSAAGFIAVTASKQVVMRFFPALTFFIDETLDAQFRIEELLGEIRQEREMRGEQDDERERFTSS